MADYKHEIDLLDSFNADVKYIKKINVNYCSY